MGGYTQYIPWDTILSTDLETDTFIVPPIFVYSVESLLLKLICFARVLDKPSVYEFHKVQAGIFLPVWMTTRQTKPGLELLD